MIEIKTFQDLLALGENERERLDFVYKAIQEHEASIEYKTASDAEKYARGQNPTIMNYQKLLYTLTGQAVPDNYSANHKCASGFFKRFVTQEASYLLGNGVFFEKDETKTKLGKDFDAKLYKGAKNALIQSVAFGFFNNDHIEIYKLTEFVPLYDEENGSLRAGIRYWQIATDKPLRATLFEENGYTDFIKRKGEEVEILHQKRPYKYIVRYSEAEGEEIYEGQNYPAFPIIPLWANAEKQSEIVGKREQIDCYDLIKSGFANDLDEASMFYWIVENAGGMDDIDLKQFIERLKIVKAATIDSEGGAKATPHTMEVPYESREVYLKLLEQDLYKDFMALNVEEIAAGNVTATQIEAAYEPLNQKTDEFELCVIDFINGILQVAGIEDAPTFERSYIRNQQETVDMILAAAEYLDDETILKKLPFVSVDEASEILRKRDAEEMARYTVNAPVVVEE